MKTTIGGDRLGSGNKQELSFRNYERSTHDLSELFRSSMSAGTLVPFLKKVVLPGDNFQIDLNCEVLTLPTIGPLFGSYKVQLDIFEIPLRLYNANLHQNRLGVGMDMASMYFPQLRVLTNNHTDYIQTFADNEHINSSCLLKYLGISGLGYVTGSTNPAYRDFNAIPLLAYWEIYKNYYSNKQEEVGYFIHSDDDLLDESLTPVAASLWDSTEETFKGNILNNEVAATTGDWIIISYPSNAPEPDPTTIPATDDTIDCALDDIAENFDWDDQFKVMRCTLLAGVNGSDVSVTTVVAADPLDPPQESFTFGIESFDLDVVDSMKDNIMAYTATPNPFMVLVGASEPYSCFMKSVGSNQHLRYSCTYSQEGLGIKTYQSDLFNNWINTEWIDGEDGIADLTAVDTSGDSFTIDALNIAQKVYAMLNRIAVSGGTYDDWLDAVYTHERVRGIENPVYHGSLIKELAFQEVISNADTEDNPLGTLAGRGQLTQKHKGGRVNITVNEPGYIMGIVSITPRIEYSQGNDWDVNLQTYDDLHKPALDAIGFQDLIIEQMVWTDTELDSSDGSYEQHSLGKQPAWINYMTSINKVYGSFADENDSMFMTLNRRYEKDTSDGTIVDGTTYIDPTKFNHIFADTALDSQNFWVQISSNITARRKMSAKVIPNL